MKKTLFLSPQYRAKSPDVVGREMEEAKAIFGDRRREYIDDTFTIDKHRAIAISDHMKRLKLTWSNARANLDYDTLKQLRDNGLRLLLVPKAIISIVKKMLGARQMLVRRLREGREFFDYLKERRTQSNAHKQPIHS